MLIDVDSTTQEVPAELPPAAMPGHTRWPAVAAGVVLAFSLGSLLWHTTAGALADNDDITLTDASSRSCPGPLSLQQRAERNAEQEALAAHLSARKVPHLVSPLDIDGVRWVEWNSDDDAAVAAVEEYYDAGRAGVGC